MSRAQTRPARARGSRSALPLHRRIREEVAARRIEVVAPRIARAIGSTAGGFLPFGFGRQPHGASERVGQPAAVRQRIVVAHEHHGMTAMAGGRLVLFPHVRGRHLPEEAVAAAGGHERQAADRTRGLTGGAHEARVFIVRDRKAADEKLAHVDTMDRTFVFLGVRRAHEKFASGNARQIRRCRRCHRACGSRRFLGPGSVISCHERPV